MNWINSENPNGAWADRIRAETKAWTSTRDYEVM